LPQNRPSSQSRNHENTKIHEEHEENLAFFFVTFETFVASWSLF